MLIPIHKLLAAKVQGIIHIGAHTAEELDYYLSCGYGKVIWIEANPARWPQLESIISNYSDMKLGKFAASSRTEGQAFLNLSGISSSLLEMGSHKDKYPGSESTETAEVNLVSTDDWIESNITEKRDYNLLNIDVQGYELEVLKGLTKQLQYVNAIYTEVNYEYLYKEGSLINEIDDFLADYGFKRVATETVKGMGWGEGLYVRGKYFQLEATVRFFIYKLSTLPKNPRKLRSFLSKKFMMHKSSL